MKKSNLFFFEVILDIFIFMLCSVVCISMLSKAARISDRSSRLTDAIFLAQSAAERFKSGEYVGSVSYENDGYLVDVHVNEKPALYADISVSLDGKTIFSLEEVMPNER